MGARCPRRQKTCEHVTPRRIHSIAVGDCHYRQPLPRLSDRQGQGVLSPRAVYSSWRACAIGVTCRSRLVEDAAELRIGCTVRAIVRALLHSPRDRAKHRGIHGPAGKWPDVHAFHFGPSQNTLRMRLSRRVFIAATATTGAGLALGCSFSSAAAVTRWPTRRLCEARRGNCDFRLCCVSDPTARCASSPSRLRSAKA